MSIAAAATSWSPAEPDYPRLTAENYTRCAGVPFEDHLRGRGQSLPRTGTGASRDGLTSFWRTEKPRDDAQTRGDERVRGRRCRDG